MPKIPRRTSASKRMVRDCAGPLEALGPRRQPFRAVATMREEGAASPDPRVAALALELLVGAGAELAEAA